MRATLNNHPIASDLRSNGSSFCDLNGVIQQAIEQVVIQPEIPNNVGLRSDRGPGQVVPRIANMAR